MSDKVSPTDVHSDLTWFPDGWELRDPGGTVKEFNAQGQWLATRDRNGNATVGTYSDGLLTAVEMPDGRSTTLAYHPEGQLATMTEVGVEGVMTRTWTYTWDGPDLLRIDRPDGTAQLLSYDDARHPSYLTLSKLRGSDGSERVEQGWQYDDYGNAAATWSGAANPEAAGAVEVHRYSYPDPWNPTEMVVTDPLGNQTTTTYRRDPDSNNALPTSTSGSCGSCGPIAGSSTTTRTIRRW